MRDIGAILGAAVGSLQSGLPPRLVALNVADELIVEPQNIVGGGVGEILVYPLLEVAVPDWSMRGFTVGQVAVEMDLNLVVKAWHQIADFPTLHDTMLVYQRAILDVLAQPDALVSSGPRPVIGSVRGGMRVNPETEERQEFTAATVIVFTIETVGVRP